MTPEPWMQTFSGMLLDLLDPQPELINLQDIAVSLSRLPRFTGHTLGPNAWSVAAHSLLTLDVIGPSAPPSLQLYALLHDAHEFATGDISSPVKWALRRLHEGPPDDPLAYLQDRIQRAILLAAGFRLMPGPAWDSAIHAADLRCLAIERDQLMCESPRPWIPMPSGEWPSLTHLTPAEAAADFEHNARRLIHAAGLSPLPGFVS